MVNIVFALMLNSIFGFLYENEEYDDKISFLLITDQSSIEKVELKTEQGRKLNLIEDVEIIKCQVQDVVLSNDVRKIVFDDARVFQYIVSFKVKDNVPCSNVKLAIFKNSDNIILSQLYFWFHEYITLDFLSILKDKESMQVKYHLGDKKYDFATTSGAIYLTLNDKLYKTYVIDPKPKNPNILMRKNVIRSALWNFQETYMSQEFLNGIFTRFEDKKDKFLRIIQQNHDFVYIFLKLSSIEVVRKTLGEIINLQNEYKKLQLPIDVNTENLYICENLVRYILMCNQLSRIFYDDYNQLLFPKLKIFEDYICHDPETSEIFRDFFRSLEYIFKAFLILQEYTHKYIILTLGDEFTVCMLREKFVFKEEFYENWESLDEKNDAKKKIMNIITDKEKTKNDISKENESKKLRLENRKTEIEKKEGEIKALEKQLVEQKNHNEDLLKKLSESLQAEKIENLPTLSYTVECLKKSKDDKNVAILKKFENFGNQPLFNETPIYILLVNQYLDNIAANEKIEKMKLAS
ncbi:hypothetical protein NGRA_2551 [Nosema granulosis]|uniref:Uncharacterized protein n=1 Tax=Nosema granulosis TaxID=83296 RepID=A0A9P6KY14_9MICR|nr:hypothetical protein NGRA_2551 [Nosema granulosis]